MSQYYWTIVPCVEQRRLGCFHDGLGNHCPASDMHIMVASPGPLTDDVYKNAFTFSRCSMEEMQRELSILTRYVTYLLLLLYYPPPAEGGYVFTSVCLSVCLYDRRITETRKFSKADKPAR